MNSSHSDECSVSSASPVSRVERREQGWGAHFIAGPRCLFRRNTLLIAGGRRVIVSTVGNMTHPDTGKRDTIGLNRFYETMVFEAIWEDPYWEADVTRQVEFSSPWQIETLDQETDHRANQMHEAVVDELTATLATNTSEESRDE